MVIGKSYKKDSFPERVFRRGFRVVLHCKLQKHRETFRKIYVVIKSTHLTLKGYHNYKTFSLENMTKELGVLLDKYVPEFPKQVSLELPKLKKVDSNEPPKLELPKLKKV